MIYNKQLNFVSQVKWCFFVLILLSLPADTRVTSFRYQGTISISKSLLPAQLHNHFTIPNKKSIVKNPKLDSTLAELAQADAALMLAQIRQSDFKMASLSQNAVQVEIISTRSDFKKINELVTDVGGWSTGALPKQGMLQAWLPIHSLVKLASYEEISYITQPQSAAPVGQFLQEGSFVTEGLSAINGHVWQQGGYTGKGVKIGIIDLEFQGYLPLMGNELPINITVKNFVDGQTDTQINTTGGPHGTGCAEIVHDIAPEATLYFAKIATITDLNEAVDWFIQEQVKVISISTVWWNESPGDGTGALVDIVNKAYNAGIFWAQAAGNERQRHWAGSFSDPDNDTVHNFTNEDEVNVILSSDGSPTLISAGTTIRLFLSWDDWNFVNQDYELILARWNGIQWERVAISENPQSGETGQAPTEGIIFTTSALDSNYGVVIKQFASNRAVHFNLFMPAFDRLDQRFTTYTAASSIANPADAANAITVAAIRRPITPYEQAVYSPEGPTNGAGGTETGGFAKPDIAAFAYVSTQSYGGGESRFLGTSPAAPHVAGAAALILSAYSDYTPMQIRTFLQGRAVDMGASGLDTIYGYGLLNLGAPPAIATNTPTATPTSTIAPSATPTATPLSTPSPTSTITPTPTVIPENSSTKIFLPSVMK